MKDAIRKSLAIVIAFSAISSLAFAQTPAMRFTRLTVDDGLSNNNVLSLLQDEGGFIWIGTNDGLNKFDGYGFTTFRNDARDSTSLSHNVVSALLLDHAGRMWVGTNDGLNLYEPATGTFTEYNAPGIAEGDDVGARHVTVLHEDGARRLWVGTTRGLFHFDVERSLFTRYGFEATSAADFRGDLYRLNYITAVFEDEADRLWIGTTAGLNLLDPALGTFRRFESASGEEILDEVRDIVDDGAGGLWVATIREGLFRLDIAARTLRRYLHIPGDSRSLPSNSVRAIHRYGGMLLVGTSEGIALQDDSEDRFRTFSTVYGDQTSLSFPGVRRILEDDRGNLWIGTWGGLSYFDRNSNHFVHVRRNPENEHSLSDDIISSFASAPDGGVWVGTELGGLNFIEPETGRVRLFMHRDADLNSLTVNNIKALLVDRTGMLWIGTHDGGLSRFDPARNQFKHFRHDPEDGASLSGDRVYAIHEDRLGNLWIGTNKSGLNRLDRATGRFVRYTVDDGPWGISSNEVNAIHEDRLGNLWIGTTHGLNLFDRRVDRFTHFLPKRDEDASLIDPGVRTIYEDEASNLWIGTSGGLELFDRVQGSFVHFTVRDGLPSDAVNCIVEDAHGRLWISTNQGLSRFDPERKNFRNFDVRDGLQSSQFNMNSCMLGADGQMYFGGINGFSRFHPDRITENPLAPPVYITELKLFNEAVRVGVEGSPLTRDISETDRITLRHDQNVISFDFVALNYTVSSRNRYAYILEEFETDWNEIGTRRSATYTNIPPGRYTFRVRASNNDGVWNMTGASLDVVVRPPAWRTWWAYLVYVALSVLAIYAGYRYSVSLIRLKNRLALEQIRRRSEDDLHAAKMQFFTNISHEFRTPLTLILGPLDELKQSLRRDEHGQENVNLIRRNAERLLRLINQLMDFRKLETNHMKLQVSRSNIVAFVHEIALSFDEFARHANVRFSVKSDYEGVYVWFDRDKLETVFTNLLSNAFKFTPDGGRVSVEIRLSGPAPESMLSGDALESGTVHVVVRDTGVGMSSGEMEHLFERFYQARPRLHQGAGIGLALAKGIVELHHGSLTVESGEGVGTTFRVSLPLGSGHLGDAIVVRDDDSHTSPDFALELHQLENGGDASPADESHVEARDRPLVLVVDDNRDMRVFVRNALSANGFLVREAGEGMEGFRVAVDTFPDLVISDVMMPEMDGMELCRKLKEDLRTSHVPVILLTARTSPADQIEGLETGADDYVTKPFDSRLLVARVTNLIKQRRKLRDRLALDLPLRPVEGARGSRDDAFLRRVIEIIESRLSDSDLTVESLSREVGMSRVYLHRKLKAVANHTPSDFIRTIRLKHAARLLLEDALSISEVGYRVGFSTPSHFATSFKKQFGLSPSEYVASLAARADPDAAKRDRPAAGATSPEG